MNVGDNYNRPKVFRAQFNLLGLCGKGLGRLSYEIFDKGRFNHYNQFKAASVYRNVYRVQNNMAIFGEVV